MARTKTPTQVYDPTNRRTAVFVGLMFLTATLSFGVGDFFVQDALSTDTAANTGLLALGVAMQAVCAVAVVGIGAGLRQVLATYHRGLANGQFAVRILEGVVIISTGVYMLATTDAVNYEPVIYLFTGTAGLMFTTVLTRTPLIPAWLAWLGVSGYIAILAVLPVELLGIASLASFPGMLLYVPGGLFEFALPILLITRGFRRPALATAVHIDEPQPAFARSDS